MQRWKKLILMLLILMLPAAVTGCGNDGISSASFSSDDGPTAYYLYYLNESQDKIVSAQYILQETDPEAEVLELVGMQTQDPVVEGARHLLPDDVTIQDCRLDDDGVLHLDLSKAIDGVTPSGKMLILGGLVRTFIQIQGVESLDVTENGKTMTDSEGNKLTNLTLNSFIENAGKTINNYLYTTMTLYFTDETGMHLVAEKRKVYYSSNEPMEKAVIEALVKGPATDGLYSVLPENGVVLSTHVQKNGGSGSGSGSTSASSSSSSASSASSVSASSAGGGSVCYVSLDTSMQTPVNNVTEEVSLYAMVDSLVDTCGVSKVQFSIKGETDTVFRDQIRLTSQFGKKVM